MSAGGRAPIEMPEELREFLDSPLHPPISGAPRWGRDGASSEFVLECLRRLRAFVAELDDRGCILYVSPTVADITGWSPAEFASPDVLQRYHPDDLERMRETGRRGVEPGELPSFRLRHRDGHWVWLQGTNYISYRTDAGQLRHVVINRDVTDLMNAAAALHESQERYRVVAEASLDVICETDEEGEMLYASPNSVEVFGYSLEEFRAISLLDVIHPEDRIRAEKDRVEALRSAKATRFEPYRVRHANGSWRWIEAVGLTYHRADGKLCFLSVARDVTERVDAERDRLELERRMQEAQRLESLGVLAGGIAHDFNNLLTPILGEASLALLDLPAASPVRARLEKIQRAAHRAAALTHQMLAYAGTGSLEPDLLDLSGLVLEMGRLLEGAASGKTLLAYELAKGLPRVLGDVSQLSQVVMNLITNAVEAVADGEGRVAIRTGSAVLDPAAPAHHVLGEAPPPGRYAWFEVEDTGCGMDAETRGRIFDPFFTTKFTGRGLGLAAVLGIVRAHRGAIELESEPGRGSRFRVWLPVAGPGAVSADALEPAAGTESWRSEATVLVVDDDTGGRELAEETLRRAGLRVLCAKGGLEALALFRQHAGEIGAVLLDRSMPQLSGEDTFRELRRARPDLPVVLVSGYTEERAARHFAAKELAGFLAKPFLPSALLGKIRAALER